MRKLARKISHLRNVRHIKNGIKNSKSLEKVGNTLGNVYSKSLRAVKRKPLKSLGIGMVALGASVVSGLFVWNRFRK